ncbi:MAG: toll/interleukin-1 receptor domain-containing protein [Eubacterium sp.]|nr:toll/interleukin-1 receptor domain-containing protein [Eubacterium sp.]
MILRCKMCGGQLNIEPDSTICECEYCGSKQTIPNTDDEKRLKLYERANRLRFDSEFDKAAGVYESIVADYQEEAEAYWGLVLCKYGIEYVDDPATGKKIPTCHRSSFDSVMDDSNFDLVMENADSVARGVYREEAKQIEEIRKGIIEVSSSEEPYDIFICYKETDEKGDRTIDSVIAQDVYNELTEKGYRVFFSRITLEDKLGQEYEPYIFAALNSAKVMLAFGTSYDYYNAVWVKNEWSRFLKLIAEGQKKTLIPCFKDIDAYDMPKEFKHLQAQDMGKVGAVQDLVRGIDKIFGKDKKVVASVLATGSTDYSSDVLDAKNQAQLKRGFIALEDEEWKDANAFFEEVLNYNAECAEAYLGKFLAKEKSKSLEEYYKGWIHKISATTDKMASNGSMVDRCVACEIDDELIESIIKKYSVKRTDAIGLSEKEIRKRFVFDRNYTSYHSSLVSYKERFLKGIEEDKQLSRARAYAGENLKANIFDVISGFETYFNERISQEETERHQKEESIKKSYKKYVDSVAEDIKKEYEEYNEKRLSDFTAIKQSARDYIEEINNPGIAQMESCLRELKTYDDMPECDAVAADLSKELKYRNAILMVDNNAWSSAKIHFEELKDYKESAALLRKCDLRIARDKAEKEEQERQEKLQQEERERKERAEKVRRKKKRRRIAISTFVVLFLIAGGVLATIFYFIPESKYKKALKKMDNEEYSEAIELFEELGGYRDSKRKLEEAEKLEHKEYLYMRAKNYRTAKLFQDPIDYLEEITPYKDSEELLKQYKYEYGEYFIQEESYDRAIKTFEELGDYKDSKERIQYINELKDKKSKYKEAVKLFATYYSKERYEMAREIFEELGDYKDSSEYLDKIKSIQIFTDENITEVSVGDYVNLGLYDGMISWYVADKKDDKLFLISTTAIGDEVYSYAEVAGNSAQESWLEWFKDYCFSEKEKELIDTVTLLSKSEAEEYLVPHVMMTLYDDNGVARSWWLKENNGVRYSVTFTGEIQITSSQGSVKHYVRPAIWIQLPSKNTNNNEE